MLFTRLSCRWRLPGALLSAWLGLYPWAATAQRVDGVPVDAGFQPAAQADALVALVPADTRGLADVRRVAITSFQVEFIVRGAASASSYEIGRSGTASVHTHVQLTGVGPAERQALTDQAHAQFQAALASAGYEVVPLARVLQAPSFQQLAGSGPAGPVETRGHNTWSVVHAPQGMPVYGEGAGTSSLPMLGGLGQMAQAFNQMNHLPALARELDAAPVQVRLVLHFADLRSSGLQRLFGRDATASVGVGISPMLVPVQSHLTVVRPGGAPLRLQLKAPLLLDGSAFAELRDTSSTAANIGLAVLSFAMGTGSSAKAQEYEAVAAPERYSTVVAAGLDAARDLLVARLAAAR